MDLMQRYEGTRVVSKRGVPHMIFHGVPGGASVCWFDTGQFWRMFTPVGCGDQRRVDCKTLEDVERELSLLRNCV